MITVSQLFVFMLLLDAGIVACGLLRKKNMWHFICLYWVLLTIKNLCDFMKW